MVKVRVAWHPTVHRITKSRTWLRDWAKTTAAGDADPISAPELTSCMLHRMAKKLIILLIKRSSIQIQKYFSVDKSIRYHFTQMIKVNITNDKLFWYYATLDIVWSEKHLTSVVFFPQIYYLHLIIRKYHTNLNWGEFNWILRRFLQKCEGHMKQEKLSLFQWLERKLNAMISWFGFWNNKWTLVENRINLNKVYS